MSANCVELQIGLQVLVVSYAYKPYGQKRTQFPVNGSEYIGEVHVGTHKFVLLSAYKSYAAVLHLYLQVLVPLESVWPYVSGAPKHLDTQYLDVGYAKPFVHFN